MNDIITIVLLMCGLFVVCELPSIMKERTEKTCISQCYQVQEELAQQRCIRKCKE